MSRIFTSNVAPQSTEDQSLALPRDALRGKPYSQIMWFEPDDCSRVAINVVSFTINSVLHPWIVATNSVEKSRCLQFEPIMIAVR